MARRKPMYCHNCGIEIVGGANFCPNCGARFAAACPNCGAEAGDGDQFCRRCGHDLAGPAGGAGGGAVGGSRAAARRPFQVSGMMVAAAVGAIMMLVSLGIPWYTFRASSGFAAAVDRDVGDLLDAPADWAGWGLPVVLFIVFASIVMLLVLGSFVTGKDTSRWWPRLGLICGLCLLGNAGFIISEVVSEDFVSLNIAAAGSIVALIGAFIVYISAAFGRGPKVR
jgi:hypothetical protein